MSLGSLHAYSKDFACFKWMVIQQRESECFNALFQYNQYIKLKKKSLVGRVMFMYQSVIRFSLRFSFIPILLKGPSFKNKIIFFRIFRARKLVTFHTDAFSFKNIYFLIRFRLPFTLKINNHRFHHSRMGKCHPAWYKHVCSNRILSC